MTRDCPVCDTEGYTPTEGCDECGHYDEYAAKRRGKAIIRVQL